MTEISVVKYDRPLNVPVQSVGGLRMLLASRMNQFQIPVHSLASLELILSTATDAALRSPDILTTCSAQSVLASIKTAAELGLTFSRALPRAHLVPFRDKRAGKIECQMIVDYRGYLDLIFRATGVTVNAQVVYAGEPFKVERGTAPCLTHEQRMDVERGDAKIVAAYSIAYFDPPHFEVMAIEELKAIRATSKQPGGLMWQQHFPEACRKTVIRRHVKYLPMSGEDRKLLEKAIEHDDAIEGLEGLDETTPAERTAKRRAWLAGESAVEGTVIEPKSEPKTDPLESARKRIGELAEARARRTKGNAGAVLANATKEALGDSVGLDELSLDQAVLVREFLESQQSK